MTPPNAYAVHVVGGATVFVTDQKRDAYEALMRECAGAYIDGPDGVVTKLAPLEPLEISYAHLGKS